MTALLTLLASSLSVVVGSLLVGIIRAVQARRQHKIELRKAFDRIKRRIETTEIDNFFPVFLHELRELMLDNEELASDPTWRDFASKWLADASVVEGQPVSRPAWTQTTTTELLRDLDSLQPPKGPPSPLTGGPGRGAPVPGVNALNVVAVLVAIITLVLMITGLARNDAQFELQRRPWLKVDNTQPIMYFPCAESACAESALVSFEITNHGAGSALHCRMAVVVNGTDRPVDLHRDLGVHNSKYLCWTFIPPGASVYSPSGITARVDTASTSASGDSFTHFCLAFDGLETGKRYYTEQILSAHANLFAREPDTGPPGVIVYRITGRASRGYR